MSSHKRMSETTMGCFVICALLVLGAIASLASAITWPLTIILLAILAVVVIRFIWRQTTVRSPTAQHLMAGLSQVSAMSGGQFEVFTAQIFRTMGYDATVLGGSGDQGVDIIIVGEDFRVAVQCKNYKKAVGNKPVQEVYAGARHHGCNRAWVVAPMGYTKGAHELAASVGVLLFDANAMRQWIKTIDEAERKAVQQSA
jgi:restriction system protein